jgi:large subunit ribosomal protein L6
MKVEKPANNLTPLILTGGDRQLLGQVAANMRALRPPDPYKNKGIRYANEPLRKKAGKTGAAGGAK